MLKLNHPMRVPITDLGGKSDLRAPVLYQELPVYRLKVRISIIVHLLVLLLGFCLLLLHYHLIICFNSGFLCSISALSHIIAYLKPTLTCQKIAVGVSVPSLVICLTVSR